MCSPLNIRAGSGPWLWPWPLLRHIRFRGSGRLPAFKPFVRSSIELYTASMTMATTMELITANVMIRLFGSFWWDYSHKPFNYRGIICLESSLAWGLLGLFFFNYLDGWVRTAVGYIPGRIGKVLAVLLTLFYVFDFIRCIRMRLGIPEEGEEGETEETIGRLKVY